MESRVLAVVAVIGERAEGKVGGRLFGQDLRTVALAFIFQFFCQFIDGEVNVCQQSKEVCLSAIAVGSSKIALV